MQRSLFASTSKQPFLVQTTKRHATFFPTQYRPDPSVEPLEPSKKPLSPNYYSGQPKFNDALDSLQRALKETRQTLMRCSILTSYSQSATAQYSALGLTPKQMHGDWLSQEAMSGSLGVHLSISHYRQLIKVLNTLRALTPHLNLADALGLPYSSGNMLEGLNQIMAPYRRSALSAIRSTSRNLAEEKIDDKGRAYAVGRRKESSAQVWMIPVNPPSPVSAFNTQDNTTNTDEESPADNQLKVGQILVNSRSLSDYFTSSTKRTEILRPFSITGLLGKYNVFALVRGGGQTGQADALKLAIAKALVVFEGDEKRRILKKEKLLTRDPRMVERKKTGRPKARKANAWVRR